jgi:hypothetical protein
MQTLFCDSAVPKSTVMYSGSKGEVKKTVDRLSRGVWHGIHYPLSVFHQKLMYGWVMPGNADIYMLLKKCRV